MPLKIREEKPMKGIAMPASLPIRFLAGILGLALLLPPETAAQGSAKGKARGAPIPVVAPEEKKEPPPVPMAEPAQPSALFEEIEFGSTLVIEGKVEKPQVQFTLLKEPPPEKEIRFETSFLQNILKQERENTFDASERYGKD
jgi:hypothetical protein